MNHRKPLASLTTRSAAIIGALAAYMIPPLTLTGVCISLGMCHQFTHVAGSGQNTAGWPG